MAHIEKLPSTKKGNGYRITVYIGEDQTGKKIKKSTTYYPTSTTARRIEQEVKAYAKDYEQQVHIGSVAGDKMTFEQAVEEWEKWAFSVVSETVKKTYRGIYAATFCLVSRP